MKIKTTLKTATKAWEILRQANLHHFLDSGVLTAIGTLQELNINISDIITKLLEGGVLIDFLITITDSPHYLSDKGGICPWDEIDLAVIGELIASFFTSLLAAWKLPIKA